MRVTTLLGIAVILIVALVGVGVVATDAGVLTLSWFGYEVRTSAAVFFAVMALVFAILLGLFSTFGALLRTPQKWRMQRRVKAAEQRERAVVSGLAAAAAGDVRAIRKATAVLTQGEGSPLEHFLNARAAQIEGDRDAAEGALRRLADEDETAVLGLRGLLGQALARRDQAGARDLAERAFRRAPNAEWAFQAHIRLCAEGGRWDAVLPALEEGARHGFVTETGPARAAALLARGACRRAEGDAEGADEDALNAVKLDLLSPVAMSEAARAWIHRDKRRKAEKLLEEGWRISPHPALADAYDAAAPASLDREARAKRLIALGVLNPEAPESRLLIAAQRIALGEWSDAASVLEPLLDGARPGRRAYRLMGDVVLGGDGDREVARAWYDRALAAAPEPALRHWRPGVGFDLAGRGGVQSFLRALGLLDDEDPLEDVSPAVLPGPRPIFTPAVASIETAARSDEKATGLDPSSPGTPSPGEWGPNDDMGGNR